ncbi:MAG: hypothetical protein HY321_03540 [Armatimonadetes bacterium]|nr:hypothetical protein [Armatimonadota bacterium]
MGAHVFLVSEANFDVCVDQGVYGCVMPTTAWNRAEIIAGILSIQPDDLVFFYVKNRGVFGLWRVVGDPFYDETPVWAAVGQTFPFRFRFEPAVGHFPVPIALTDVLDLRDRGRIWTFDLNPVQQKNQYKITTDEARELLRLLLRNNPVRGACVSTAEPYEPRARAPIHVDLTGGKAGRAAYEAWLNAWFVSRFRAGALRDVFGTYSEFLNLVPTTFNKVMDLFLTHSETVDSVDVTYKFSCIELKCDAATEKDLGQVLRYEDWLARRLAGGDSGMVQSILIAYRFAEPVIDYVKNRQRIEEKTVRLIAYRVTDAKTDVCLEEVAVTG